MNVAVNPPLEPAARRGSRSGWQSVSLRLAVALAFADASVVVLALPQIVDRLNTTISHAVWVIMAYNVALIVTVVLTLWVPQRLGSRQALLAGIGLFGLASIGCGVAGSLKVLVAFRCLQGAGGALLLCASLPLLAAASTGSRRGSLRTWATAAALGTAIGPAAGGVLTELFDWRAIFLAQAPAAALAAAAVLLAGVQSTPPTEAAAPTSRQDIGPGLANVGLGLLSAALIGALFLVVILLINVWGLTPLAAAAVVSAIPLSAALLERVAHGRSAAVFGLAGAILLALGLAIAALIPHREVGLIVVALIFCGSGLGLAFPTLTAAALPGHAASVRRAGRTVAFRDGGLVVGLLILTPVFVHDLQAAPAGAVPPIAIALYSSPIPKPLKDPLAGGMLADFGHAGPAQLPDLQPAFTKAAANQSSVTVSRLAVLKRRIDSIIREQATHAFRRALLFSAVFALLVLAVLALPAARVLRTRGSSAIARE